jgi:hypothetical protein
VRIIRDLPIEAFNWIVDGKDERVEMPLVATLHSKISPV